MACSSLYARSQLRSRRTGNVSRPNEKRELRYRKASQTRNMKRKLKKIDMSRKRLGNSDLSITPVGFGAWAIGGSGWEFGWGEQDDKQSVASIHRALELGINWIDTAAAYGMGHSETVASLALRTWSGVRPYVCT